MTGPETLTSLNFTTSQFDTFLEKMDAFAIESTNISTAFSFERLATEEETFSKDDLDILYDFEFSLPSSDEDRYLEQFELESLSCCGQIREIVSLTSFDTVLQVSSDRIIVTYENSYFELYKVLGDALTACKAAECFDGDCNLLSVKEDASQKKSTEFCDFPEYVPLGDVTGRITVNYRIPGASHHDYFEKSVAKNSNSGL